MEQDFTTGTGHFGEQAGDAGQKKHFVQPRSRVQERSDPIQKRLWDKGIMVEVRNYKENAITGRAEVFIVGASTAVDAAIEFCKGLTPPVDVVHSKRG